MNVLIQPVLNGGTADELEPAARTLNLLQTVWRFRVNPPTRRTEARADLGFVESIPVDRGIHGPETVIVRALTGKVESGGALCSYNATERSGVISEFPWHASTSLHVRGMYAMSLMNITLRAYLGRECPDPTCMTYHSHKNSEFDKVWLSLHLCSDCQRTLEAIDPYRVVEIVKVVEWLKLNAATDYDIGELVTIREPKLPVLKHVLGHQDLPKQLFQAYGIILVMHFLEDLIPFLSALTALGARPEAISLLVKPYPYGDRVRVGSYCSYHYPQMEALFLKTLPPSDDQLQRVVETGVRASESGKVLVIEDGGYIVPYLHRVYENCADICIGAVEQTTKGLRNDDKVKLKIPVVNVAKSEFKDRFEPPLVGKAVVANVQRLLEPLGVHLQGQKAAVIGFGAIGREVAESLRDAGMVTRVYDTELIRMCEANVRGFEVGPAATILRDARLVIGTVGKCSIGKNELNAAASGVILASASSDQIEIDLQALDQMCSGRKERHHGLGTRYIEDLARGEKEFWVLGDGYPINFFRGQGIPNQSIDPILCLLLLGAVRVATGGLEPGITKGEVIDEVMTKYKLLEELMHVHEYF